MEMMSRLQLKKQLLKVQLMANRGSCRGSGLAMPYPWPNNPVELTAHSVRFFGYLLHFLLWAAAHRERYVA